MRGFVRARVPFVKTLASALTIGSGGTRLGRERPIAQVGAGFGSALATWLKAGDRERANYCLLAGCGRGDLGAVFRAPLGGALFAVEVLYRDIEFEGAGPGARAFVASIAVVLRLLRRLSGRWGAIFTVTAII